MHWPTIESVVARPDVFGALLRPFMDAYTYRTVVAMYFPAWCYSGDRSGWSLGAVGGSLVVGLPYWGAHRAQREPDADLISVLAAARGHLWRPSRVTAGVRRIHIRILWH